jgi:hypothetical protein
MRNFQLAYRPLVGGIAIYNHAVGRLGTLGLIGRDAAGAFWLVSAAHVLVGTGLDAERLYQPVLAPGAAPVAYTSRAHVRLSLDVAAARVDPTVAAELRVLCAPPLAQPTAATVGMNVVKVGATTGVTEGVVTAIGAMVRVEPRPSAPPGYNLTDGGDSGAAWLDAATGSPVAIHVAGNPTGREFSDAVPIGAIAGWGLVYT